MNVWGNCDHCFTYQPDQPKSSYSQIFQLLHFSTDFDEILFGGIFWLKHKVGKVWSRYNHFLTYQPDQPNLYFWKQISRWANFANFHSIWFKLGTEVICIPPIEKWTFEDLLASQIRHSFNYQLFTLLITRSLTFRRGPKLLLRFFYYFSRIVIWKKVHP